MFSIRHATAHDLRSLLACDAFAQGHESRRLQLEGWVAAECCFVAELDGEVAGFVVVQHNFFGHGFIPLLCVAARHQGRGVGRQLLTEAERRCHTRKLFASANASNARAHALLERAGFVRSGVIENLDEGDPEVVFYKPLFR